MGDIIEDDKRAGAVIDRVRALLRKDQSEQRPFDLNPIVAEAIGLVHQDLVARNVTVESHLASDLPPIVGDRVQLQQVLLNLILNAADALAGNPKQDRLIRVMTEKEDSMLKVSVSDNGSGIPSEKVSQIFEPFFTTKGQGMGRGLAISRTIISAHGGSLWAENNADGGASFHFSLPLDGCRN